MNANEPTFEVNENNLTFLVNRGLSDYHRDTSHHHVLPVTTVIRLGRGGLTEMLIEKAVLDHIKFINTEAGHMTGTVCVEFMVPCIETVPGFINTDGETIITFTSYFVRFSPSHYEA